MKSSPTILSILVVLLEVKIILHSFFCNLLSYT